MNDPEARRRELLRQTRKLYDDDRFIPAIHPRYGSIYRELYGNDEDGQGTGGSFFVRLGIGLICFAFYIWMDTSGASVINVNSGKVVEQIEKQIQLEDVEEAWKSL